MMPVPMAVAPMLISKKSFMLAVSRSVSSVRLAA